jgi:predicted acylesterase/phospholipase RssA
MSTGRRIICSLGSGAAYGYAHIGVLKYLEERKIEVGGIAGTSMGAIVGGLYAYGYRADELEELSSKLNTLEIAKWFFPTFPKGGLIDSDNVKKFLSSLIGTARIENLPIPFRCVATDILTGTEVVFDSGPLIDGIVASMSIQGMFKPYHCRGLYLCDGALCNPVPWDIGNRLGDRNLIVNVIPTMGILPDGTRKVVFSSQLGGGECVEEETGFLNGIRSGSFLQSFKEIMDNLMSRKLSIHQLRSEIRHKESENLPSLMDVLMNWTFMTGVERKIPKPEPGKRQVLVEPEVSAYSPFDFRLGKELIRIGWDAAAALKDRIEELAG